MSKDDKLSNDFLEMLSDEELYLLIDMLPYKPFFELIKNNPKEFKNETMGCTMNISSNMLKKRVPDILFNTINCSKTSRESLISKPVFLFARYLFIFTRAT